MQKKTALIKTIQLNHDRVLKVFASGWVRLFRAPNAVALRNNIFYPSYFNRMTDDPTFVKAGQPMPTPNPDWHARKFLKFENAEAALKYADEFAARFNSRYPSDMFDK